MASGYRSGGVDFDDLFDPYVSGTKSIITGRRVNGVDLRDRYAPLSVGSKRANVGHRVGGVDVSNLWAAKGTAQYSIAGLQGKVLSAVGSALTSGTSASAVVSVSIRNDGTWSVSGGNNLGNVPQSSPTSGTWVRPGASPADFDFRLRVTSTGDATATNSASEWRRANSGGAAAASISVTTPGGTIEIRSAQMTVLVDLRDRSSGNVSTTSLSGVVTAQGFL